MFSPALWRMASPTNVLQDSLKPSTRNQPWKSATHGATITSFGRLMDSIIWRTSFPRKFRYTCDGTLAIPLIFDNPLNTAIDTTFSVSSGRLEGECCRSCLDRTPQPVLSADFSCGTTHQATRLAGVYDFCRVPKRRLSLEPCHPRGALRWLGRSAMRSFCRQCA